VQERDFKGIWIPREIWLTSELTLLEKIFLVEIDSLDNDQNCYASNAYFAEFFGISKGRCTQIIKSLEAKGFIQIQLIRDKNVIKKRVIKVVRKLNTPIAKTKQGYLENAEDNNISEPQAFIDYHESRGWVVGRSPMKDWKSAFRRWETNQKKWSKENANKQSSSERRSAYASNLYDYSKATNFQ
jgi:hypothetical protein